MKIGYIYLYGEEWEEWQKKNPPLAKLIEELKELRCDKIYMDVFIEDYTLTEIERIDMKELLERISGSSDNDEFELYIRGRVDSEAKMDDKDFQLHFMNEVKRIEKRHNRQI